MQPTFGMENVSFYTAIDDLTQLDEFTISAFPNPFANKLQIVFELDNSSPVTVELHNLLGQKVTALEAENYSAGRHELTVETSGLSEGLWICRISSNGEYRTIKLLKGRK
jgi:hypothetical protein